VSTDETAFQSRPEDSGSREPEGSRNEMKRVLTLALPEGHHLNQFVKDSPEFKAHLAELDREQARLRDGFWKAHDWQKYIFIHIQEHRWQALEHVAGRLFPRRIPTLAQLFRMVWVDSENFWAERRRISRLVRLIGDKHRRHLMTEKDLEEYLALPERFKVYRGAKPWNVSGRSWTRNCDRACYFATHTHHQGSAAFMDPKIWGSVYEKIIKREDVLFCTDERTEEEVITRRSYRGRLSPEGQIWLALELGPKTALVEYERQKHRLDPDARALFSPQVLGFWHAIAGEEETENVQNI
jgi:hypothetical protein